MQPTNWRSDGQGDAVAALLDQVHDVPVVEGVDLHVVHGQNSVSNLEATTSLCWRACKYETFPSADFTNINYCQLQGLQTSMKSMFICLFVPAVTEVK